MTTPFLEGSTPGVGSNESIKVKGCWLAVSEAEPNEVRSLLYRGLEMLLVAGDIAGEEVLMSTLCRIDNDGERVLCPSDELDSELATGLDESKP